jgi:kynurenine formamidase
MRRWILAGMALVGGILANLALGWHEGEEQSAKREVPVAKTSLDGAAEPEVTLEQLAAGKLTVIDLGWPLNAAGPRWPGENYKPFELHTIATLERDGVLSKAFASPEHLGTHLDAPNHFEHGRPSVDQIPPDQLFAPGVVLDVRASATADNDYRVSLADVEAFEQAHGQIPAGAIVLADTGWSKFWGLPDRYRNQDAMSRMHFPGFSAEAVQFLIEKRQIKAIGLDTMSVDHGLSRDFVVHHVLGKAGRYGLENLAQLNKLPPRGFYLFVAPIKIETGSGGPARVFAILGQ